MKTKTFLAINKFRAFLRPDFLSAGYGRSKGDMEAFGTCFSNRLGLGPGIDLNGDFIDSLSELDFSHICVGPVTLDPQENDPDVSSKGVRYALSRLNGCVKTKLLALDITCSRKSSEDDEQALKDFIDAFDLSYDFADFFILDFSVPYLRNRIDPSYVISILDPILEARLTYETYRPLLVKLAPAGEGLVSALVDYFRMSGVDGIILEGMDSISFVNSLTDSRFPIVASGCSDGAEAARLLSVGATLIHISKELPAEGKKLISDILKATEQVS